MNSQWPKKTLGELLSFLTSGSRGWAEHYRKSGDLFLRIQNVGRNKMMLDDVAFVAAPDTAEAQRTLVQAGDVLLSITADLGRTGVVPDGIGRAYINQHLAILRVKDILPTFLSAFLASPEGQRQVMGRNRHAVKAGLNFEDIRSFQIPLPPLAMQQKITDVLERAESLRAKRRQALAKLDCVTQSLFGDLFGNPKSILDQWPTRPLGELLEFLTSGSRGWASYYADSGDLFLRIQNIRWDEIFLDDIAYVQAPDTAEARRTRVQPGDVLFSMTADLGRTAVVPEGIGTAYINQHLAILRTRAINSRFLSAFFASPAGQRQVAGRNRSAVKAGLNFDDIRSFEIPCPPREIQQEFEIQATAVERLKLKYQKSLSKLDKLFASLQHRAFNGEL